jgi:uncharacterized membrane protein
MNKKEFFEQLREELKDLPESDLNEILSDYEEHFEIGKTKKRSEKEIIEKLGDPTIIAKEFKTIVLVKKAEQNTTFGNVTRVVFASLGLGFFNLVFVFGPFVGALAVLFSLFITGISLVMSGFASIFLTVFSSHMPWIVIESNPIAIILSSISIICAGSLLSIATYYLSKFFFKITLKYIKLNFNIITKGE